MHKKPLEKYYIQAEDLFTDVVTVRGIPQIKVVDRKSLHEARFNFRLELLSISFKDLSFYNQAYDTVRRNYSLLRERALEAKKQHYISLIVMLGVLPLWGRVVYDKYID